jgi:DNA-binding LacI/PurR family transcriptional regulator
MSEVAERAGVSKMTVSAVLAGGSRHVRVSAETRQRVLDTAQAMGYRPNAVARSLRRRRTHLFGLYSGFGFLNARNAFLADIIGGAQAGCDELGRDLLLHGSFAGRPVEEIHAELADGRIDGLITHSPPDDPLLQLIARSHLPAVAVTDSVPVIPSVVVDDAAGGRLLMEYLAGRGHRRLVMTYPARKMLSATRRRAGAQEVAARLGMSVSDYEADTPYPHYGAWLAAWAAEAQEERPTAVVCWCDQAAYELLAACRDRGLRVPDDLAITGYDDTHQPLDFQWRLTTVRAPWSEVAKTAVQLLAAQLDGVEVPMETILPVELVPGNSA